MLAAMVVLAAIHAGVFFSRIEGGARSNPSNRGDPFLASLRAIMGEGGMDKSAPPGAAARPPGAEGTVHVRQVICNAGDSLGPFLTPVLHAEPASLVDQTAVSTRLVRPIRPVWSTRLESCKPDQTGLVGAFRSISSGAEPGPPRGAAMAEALRAPRPPAACRLAAAKCS